MARAAASPRARLVATLVLLALAACGEREPPAERFVQNTVGWAKMERLHAAAAAGEADVVRALVAGGVHVDARDVNDETPLMTAAGHRRLPVVELLIAAGADVDAVSFLKMTPLMFAARTGDLPVVHRLLAAAADVDARGDRGFTALTFAAAGGHLAVVSELLRAGADPAGGGPAANASPRGLARQRGYRDVVEVLDRALRERPATRLARRPAQPEEPAPGAGEGEAPVYAALAERERDLLVAARRGDNWLLEEILEDPGFTGLDGRDEEGRTALMLAARFGHEKVVKMLLDAGAAVDLTRGFYGESALKLAAVEGHLEVVRLLLDARADPDLGMPLLRTSKYSTRNEISLALIEAGAYVNLIDDDGITPLRHASARCDVELTEALLDAGASLDDPDFTFGRTSFEFLARRKDRGKCNEVYELFIAAGAVEAGG